MVYKTDHDIDIDKLQEGDVVFHLEDLFRITMVDPQMAEREGVIYEHNVFFGECLHLRCVGECIYGAFPEVELTRRHIKRAKPIDAAKLRKRNLYK